MRSDISSVSRDALTNVLMCLIACIASIIISLLGEARLHADIVGLACGFSIHAFAQRHCVQLGVGGLLFVQIGGERRTTSS